jgi:hypothetical protein
MTLSKVGELHKVLRRSYLFLLRRRTRDERHQSKLKKKVHRIFESRPAFNQGRDEITLPPPPRSSSPPHHQKKSKIMNMNENII